MLLPLKIVFVMIKDINGNGLVEIMIIYSGDLCIE
jgi:hypothetical protein